MKDYEPIHQHIKNVLEERGLDNSLSDLFQKHKLLSHKVWRLFSFVVLFPLCIENASACKVIITNLIGSSTPSSLAFNTFLFFFSLCAFFAPIVLSTLLLTTFLPLYKLSKKSFFKKYLGKYLRKSPILASSCDTMHYKEEFILKYSQDVEFNLAMSSYYQYLLQFSLGKEVDNYLKNKINKLLDIEINSETYKKNFTSIVISFLQDFEHFSQSPTILKNLYQQKINNYSEHIFNPEDYDVNEDNYYDNPIEESKKKFKEML